MGKGARKVKTVIQNEKVCYVCGTIHNLHDHHIFYGTSNRRQSEKHGLKVWLCEYHHNMSDEGVHFNKEFDLHLKQKAQKEFEKTHSREEFLRVFGRNYL